MSESLIVRIIAGYVSTALFLPMVAMGMHHGLVALYSVQLETFGYVTLYPALAMAGAGQVGAAVAIYFKAKKCGNTRLKNVITGALPAGLLGIGEPLIYGVTLPWASPSSAPVWVPASAVPSSWPCRWLLLLGVPPVCWLCSS